MARLFFPICIVVCCLSFAVAGQEKDETAKDGGKPSSSDSAPAKPPPLPPMVTRMMESNSGVNTYAQRILPRFRPTKDQAAIDKWNTAQMSSLQRALGHKDWRLRYVAVYAVGAVDMPPEEAVKKYLIQFRKVDKRNSDGDVVKGSDGKPVQVYAAPHQVRYLAIDGLHALGKDAKPAVPALAAALNERLFHMKARAADALAAIGPDAAEAEAALTELVKHPNPTVRKSAEAALASIKK